MKRTTDRKPKSKSKEFQRKYFPSCYARGRVYLEKKAIQKNPIQKNFLFKNLVRSTISNIHIRGLWGSGNQITKHERQ